MKIIVVGGGYAGLSCLMELKRKCPDSERLLVDPATHHVKLTRLHESLDRPMAHLRISFEDLGRRYGFGHIRERPILRPSGLAKFAASGRIPIGARSLKFDRLVVANGAKSKSRPAGAGFYAIGDLRRMEGMKLVERIAGLKGRSWVTVVGGGATGLQYLFQLRDAMRRVGAGSRLRLIDGGDQLLPEQPAAFHRYIKKRLDQSHIRYLPGRRLHGASEGHVSIENQTTGTKTDLRSAITLVFRGLEGNPVFLPADSCGRMLYEDRPLEKILVAGDCSDYSGHGLNTKSAQAAVRKGRHIAAVIRRQQAGRKPLRYSAKDLGFFLSMGTLDGIGWMGSRSGVVTGVPAFAIREAIERRYDLFVAGLDAYRVL